MFPVIQITNDEVEKLRDQLERKFGRVADDALSHGLEMLQHYRPDSGAKWQTFVFECAKNYIISSARHSKYRPEEFGLTDTEESELLDSANLEQTQAGFYTTSAHSEQDVDIRPIAYFAQPVINRLEKICMTGNNAEANRARNAISVLKTLIDLVQDDMLDEVFDSPKPEVYETIGSIAGMGAPTVRAAFQAIRESI